MIIECNPRATDGMLLMEDEELAGGITDPTREPRWSRPGAMTQLDFAVFGRMFDEGLKEAPARSTTSSKSAAPTAAGTTSCPTSTRSWPSATTSG